MAGQGTTSNIQIRNAAIETIRSNDPLKHQIQIGTSQTNSYFTGRSDSIVFGTKPQTGKLYGMEMKNYDSNNNTAGLQYLYSPRTNVVNTYPFFQVNSLDTSNASTILRSDHGNFSTLGSLHGEFSTIRVGTIYAEKVVANDLFTDGLISGRTIQALAFETNGTTATAENAVNIDGVLYWIQTYLVPSKPSAVEITGSNIKGAELNVQWKNPETISFGINSWMPVMSKLKVRLTDNSSPQAKTATLTRTAMNEVPAGVGSLDALTAVALRKFGTTGSLARTINGSNVNTLLVNLSNDIQGFSEPLKAEIWLENNKGAGPIATLTNLTFPTASPPGVPGLTLSGATSSIFTITPIAPTTNDTSLPAGDVAMPDLAFYAIKYKALNNAVRNGGLSDSPNWVQINPNPTTTNPITLRYLHPDTEYEVQIAATNANTTTASGTASDTITTNGTTFRPPYLNSVTSIDFTSVYAPPASLYKINGGNVLDYPVLNASANTTTNALYSATFGPIGLHCFNNRGSTGEVGGLYFDNGVNQATFSTIGFPVSQSESASSRDNTIITPVARSDAGTAAIDQGYFVKETFKIGLVNYGSSKDLHTLTLKQTLADNTTYSKEIKFYTDKVDATKNPSITSKAGQLGGSPTNLCGLKVYGTSVEYAISNVQCSNVSEYFTLGLSTLFTKFGSKSAVVLDKSSGIHDDTTMTMVMLFNTPTPVSFNFDSTDYYQNKSGNVSVQVKNTTADSDKNTSLASYFTSFPILVDPASIATAAAHTRYAVPAGFTTNPLSAFDDSAVLANGELMLYQGKYVSKGTSAAFIDYGAIAASGGATAVNYSTSPSAITRFNTNASNYRYAVFRFDINSGSGTTTIPTLTISLQGSGFSVLTTTKAGSSIKLVGDTGGRNIELWYKASQGATSTRWIDATSDINIGSFQSLAIDTSYSSVLGGADRNPGQAALGGGINFFVQVPPLQRNGTTITMYVMAGISDSSSIGISRVTAGLAS